MPQEASSINQSLLDKQPSNALSNSFNDPTTSERLRNEVKMLATHKTDEQVKEAIVDLYLAIKIRSTEELDAINESGLKNEKKKLMNEADSF